MGKYYLVNDVNPSRCTPSAGLLLSGIHFCPSSSLPLTILLLPVSPFFAIRSILCPNFSRNPAFIHLFVQPRSIRSSLKPYRPSLQPFPLSLLFDLFLYFINFQTSTPSFIFHFFFLLSVRGFFLGWLGFCCWLYSVMSEKGWGTRGLVRNLSWGFGRYWSDSRADVTTSTM